MVIFPIEIAIINCIILFLIAVFWIVFMPNIGVEIKKLLLFKENTPIVSSVIWFYFVWTLFNILVVILL